MFKIVVPTGRNGLFQIQRNLWVWNETLECKTIGNLCTHFMFALISSWRPLPYKSSPCIISFHFHPMVKRNGKALFTPAFPEFRVCFFFLQLQHPESISESLPGNLFFLTIKYGGVFFPRRIKLITPWELCHFKCHWQVLLCGYHCRSFKQSSDCCLLNNILWEAKVGGRGEKSVCICEYINVIYKEEP